MHDSVLPIGSSAEIHPGLVGSKAHTLHRLLQAGFPVPPGICVTTTAFQDALAPFAGRILTLIQGSDLRDPQAALQAGEQIASLLHDLRLPSGLAEKLAEALPSPATGLYAVRSSAVAEDTPGSSYAGQYHTKLGVKTAAELEAAILACWRSYFSPNALAARAMRQESYRSGGDDPGMAVLIQPLLDAECSGVCFTIDPVRLRPDLLLVVSAWGLGAGVVDGSVPVDAARLHRTDLGLEESTLANKEICIRPGPAGGIAHAPVSQAKRRVACLPGEWQERVAQFALAAEQLLGEPQDVEWTISEGQVWMLQSRPVTALPDELRRSTRFPVDWSNAEEPRHFWWLERINNRAEGVLLPVEFEFFGYRIEGGQAAVDYAGMQKTRWWKCINGCAYMTVADSPLSPGECRVRGAALDDLFERLQDQNVTLWEHWGPEIERATRRLAGFDGQNASSSALADHLEDAMATAKRHWMVHTLVPRRGRLARLSAAYQRLTGQSPEETDQELPYLLQGVETAQTRLVEALYELARLAAETPSVAACIRNRSPVAYTRLVAMPEASAFMERFERLMAGYGERVCYRQVDASPIELPLTWREVPQHVLEMIAAYLPAGGEAVLSPQDARQNAVRETQARVEAFCASTLDPAAREDFLHWLDFTRRNAAFTDEHNHFIDQLAEGQYVQALLYAGRWLTERGDLSHPYQVFWLQSGEILAALRAESRQDFTKTIAARQEQFDRWSILLAPATIGAPDARLPERPVDTSAPEADARPDSPNLSNSLRGQAASRGLRAGRARIVPETSPLPGVAPGDVLIAVNAGPLWTPVFPLLSGIVLDAGSAGDHAAITAREFGIPAVFAARNATQRIPEGAWVTVDGENGIVQWDGTPPPLREE